MYDEEKNDLANLTKEAKQEIAETTQMKIEDV